MNATLKQIYTLKLLIAFKMAYSCCFSLGENLDFLESLQKKFYNINYRKRKQGRSLFGIGKGMLVKRLVKRCETSRKCHLKVRRNKILSI